jgi:hypothetical protein
MRAEDYPMTLFSFLKAYKKKDSNLESFKNLMGEGMLVECKECNTML